MPVIKFAAPKFLFPATIVLFLAFFSSFRFGMGADYEVYEGIYLGYGLGDYAWLNLEPIFIVLVLVLRYLNEDPRIFFIATSFIFCGSILLGWVKYSPSLTISLFTFLGFFYYFNSFNIIRQSLAMGLVFAFATGSLVSGKFIKYSAGIALSSMVHFTAVIMIPLYFLCRRSYSLGAYIMLLVLFFVIYFFTCRSWN